jgi:hypothetical protein
VRRTTDNHRCPSTTTQFALHSPELSNCRAALTTHVQIDPSCESLSSLRHSAPLSQLRAFEAAVPRTDRFASQYNDGGPEFLDPSCRYCSLIEPWKIRKLSSMSG